MNWADFWTGTLVGAGFSVSISLARRWIRARRMAWKYSWMDGESRISACSSGKAYPEEVVSLKLDHWRTFLTDRGAVFAVTSTGSGTGTWDELMRVGTDDPDAAYGLFRYTDGGGWGQHTFLLRKRHQAVEVEGRNQNKDKPPFRLTWEKSGPGPATGLPSSRATEP